MKRYILTKIEPCADYDGITIEGSFEKKIDVECCISTLNKMGYTTNKLNEGGLILAGNQRNYIYIYDFRRFVISKVEDEKRVNDILDNIVNDAEKSIVDKNERG